MVKNIWIKSRKENLKNGSKLKSVGEDFEFSSKNFPKPNEGMQRERSPHYSIDVASTSNSAEEAPERPSLLALSQSPKRSNHWNQSNRKFVVTSHNIWKYCEIKKLKNWTQFIRKLRNCVRSINCQPTVNLRARQLSLTAVRFHVLCSNQLRSLIFLRAA